MKSGCRAGDASGEVRLQVCPTPEDWEASAEMSLSAAVLACCAVWKSSVMAHLMVIVQGGERRPCLHAGICGGQSGGLGGSGVESGARWTDFTLGFACFLFLCPQISYRLFMAPLADT